MYLSTIELQKEAMTFAAGHTTIFSSTEREPLHGHQYQVYLGLTTRIEENGLTFDYRYYKNKINSLCKKLHQTFLMPGASPWMMHEEDNEYHYFIFNGKRIPFLKEDVLILPLVNITVEELSRWFVTELLQDQDELQRHRIERIVVKVFSAPGQSGSFTWERNGAG